MQRRQDKRHYLLGLQTQKRPNIITHMLDQRTKGQLLQAFGKGKDASAAITPIVQRRKSGYQSYFKCCIWRYGSRDIPALLLTGGRSNRSIGKVNHQQDNKQV